MRVYNNSDSIPPDRVAILLLYWSYNKGSIINVGATHIRVVTTYDTEPTISTIVR